VRYQVWPPERVDTSRIEVRRWALENRRDNIRAGDRLPLEQLTEAWTKMYETVHASWSPTGPRNGLLAEFGPMIQNE
jgi:hypothetical protein